MTVLLPDAMVGALIQKVTIAYLDVATYVGSLDFDKNVTRQVVTRINPTAMFPGEQSIGGLADGTFSVKFPNNSTIMRLLFWLQMTGSVFPFELHFGLANGGFKLYGGTAFITDNTVTSNSEQPQDDQVMFRWDTIPSIGDL